MKYFLALVVVLVALSACTSNPPAANTTANTNSKAAPEADMRTDPNVNLEKKALDDLMKKNWNDFQALLTDDYVKIAPEATYDKTGTIDDVKKLSIDYLTLTNWKVIKIGNDAAIVVYTSRIKGKYKDQPIPDDAPPVYSSTAWVNRGGSWLAAFHQESAATTSTSETDVKPGKSATPSTATRPSNEVIVSPPTADGITDEKILWEMLKTQNWNGFASMLDEDAIEVEPDGIISKTNSVEGIKSAGDLFSKFATSDFKMIKLTDSAVLVTYESHFAGTKPVAYRESTIWANRNGNWLAVLHQGTEVVKPGAGGDNKKKR